MNIPSYLPGPPSRFLTGSAGHSKLNAALDRLKAAQDATDPAAITEAVAKVVRPVAERLAQAQKDRGVTVHTSSLPNVPGPTPPTDQSKFKLPTGTDPKPDHEPPAGFKLPKSEETSNE